MTRLSPVRWIGIAVLSGLLWSGGAHTGQVSPGSWRPFANSNVLVILGMGKGEVLLKAGPPDFKDVISLGTDGTATISVWTYTRSGHNAAVATLTFSGNRLTKIEVRVLKP